MIIDVIKRRKIFFVLTGCLFCLFLLLSFYYQRNVHNRNYIGIRVQKVDGDWYIKRIQYDGGAHALGLSVGDKVVLIDNEKPENHNSLSRWLVIEDVETISVLEGNTIREIKFGQQYTMAGKYTLLWLIGLSGFGFLLYYIKKKNVGLSGTFFYAFITLTIFLIVSIVPSSMGVGFARLIVILYVSVFPFFIDLFLKAYHSSFIYQKNSNYIVELTIGSFNVGLCIITMFTDTPYIVSEYLAQGVFGVLALLLLFVFVNNSSNMNKDEKERSSVNIAMICVVSFAPLFLLYLFPVYWDVPFVLVIPFIVLPIIAIFHLLVTSKLISNRYSVPKRGIYAILSSLIIGFISVMIRLNEYIPTLIVMIYGFFFFIVFMPLIDEILSLKKRENQKVHSLQLFGAVEEERENISVYIHDTVIQNVIYSMKRIEMMEEINKKDVLYILDEIIFYLRELCSDIYPLMIQELGLENAILSVVSQIEKKYPVVIRCNVQVEKFEFSLRKCNFVLRSIKELINNSILHGRAKEIEVAVLERDNYCVIIVKDNGKFEKKKEVKESHFGLELIKEKVTLLNGEITIDIENGTAIAMKIPFDLNEVVRNENCID